MSPISSREFTVGLLRDADTIPRAVRRVVINADIMKSTKTAVGDTLTLTNANDVSEERSFSIGVAWPSSKLSHGTILVSSSLLLTAHIEEGAKIRVFPLSGTGVVSSPLCLPSLPDIPKAMIVQLSEISPVTSCSNPELRKRSSRRRDWMVLLLKELLVDLKYITSSQIVDIVYEGEKRTFSVGSVSRGSTADLMASPPSNSQSVSIRPASQIWQVGWGSTVSIVENRDHLETLMAKADLSVNDPNSEAYASLGGLDKQIAQIRDLVELPLTRPDLFRHFGLKPPRGVLLHGPPGTGKTLLARAIASSTRSAVLVINGPELSSAYHGETESKLRDVFKEARQKSPCIVVLDEVDALVPRRDEGFTGEVEKRVVATLLTILDGMEDEVADGDSNSSRVVVIGTTNRPNAIDPALRRPGRFDREIEIGVPDADARYAILNAILSKMPHSITQDELRSVAARAHGYVGADLSAVVREAGTLAIKRCLAAQNSVRYNDLHPSTELSLTLSDLSTSLPTVRASAMRSLFFDNPPMRYSDIGGQENVIQKLREAVEWPLLHGDVFERLGVKPPKGILLYGPPGCSKTILVRACACESGVNFIAVKGPELLNSYLGESERAVREIFRKARAASPSILFFDEVDALATSRSTTDTGPIVSHEGVLTSLLNEMDGVQELLGVTVVAATNRPEMIDSALMRPGRLDRLLYVGPPDQKAREEILKIRTRKMSVAPDIDITELAKITAGCSGAEITAICQEAAMFTMQMDMKASHVSQDAFIAAAKATQRQLTQETIQKFEKWRERHQTKHF